MYGFHLSDNIVRLRRERKMTQEEVADFIGVTKASVSKWENQQSTPDIMLLPQLAALFDVTVDELMGYEAQMSKEQIRRCYLELTNNFTKMPFQEAMDKVRELTHRYYSCYPFLMQVCVLHLNHFMLAETEEERQQILRETVVICDRILERCSDVGICNDAISMKAVIKLQMGNMAEVIEMLEPVADSFQISEQNDMLLIQAYQMAGELEKAKSYTQIRQYLSMLKLVNTAMSDLSLYMQDMKRCEETIRRMKGMMKLYQLEQLHPNQAAQCYYQMAVVYAVQDKREEALEELKHFEQCVCSLLESEQVFLHRDAYFDRLEEWIEQLPLGDQTPRDRAFVRQNVVQALSHPAFTVLKDMEEYQNMIHHMEKGGK